MIVANGEQAREWAESWNRIGRLTEARIQSGIDDSIVCANLCRRDCWATEAGHWDAVNVLASYLDDPRTYVVQGAAHVHECRGGRGS